MESEILLKLSKGDKSAFRYIFDAYYKSVCLFIQKVIRDPDLSQDIAQEIFLKIWEKKLFFPNSVALKSYLFQAAKNRSINAINHLGVRKKYYDSSFSPEKSDNFFIQNYIEQETKRLIIKTVGKLPQRAREVLYMSLDGHKNQEIANGLNISIHTVKAHKAFAYKFLKENLKDLIFLFTSLFIKI
jgi:RNA polymerase sigma-70 factor (ECF subfamily)